MTTRRVLKWDVPVDDHHHPIGAGKVVLVECQHTPRVVQVWTEEEARPTLAERVRAAIVVGTGHDVPEGLVHIGSTVTAGGGLVWHVYADPCARLDP